MTGRIGNLARGTADVDRIISGMLTALLAMVFATAAAAGALPRPQGPTVLEVQGAIGKTNAEGAALFDMEMLQALPVARLETSTAVTDGVRSFEGFLMRDLLAHVEASGNTVTATALNNYVIDFDAQEFERYDVVVAYRMDGETLQPSDKGPLWIVYPRDQHTELQDIRYDYRWVWQLMRLEIR